MVSPGRFPGSPAGSLQKNGARAPTCDPRRGTEWGTVLKCSIQQFFRPLGRPWGGWGECGRKREEMGGQIRVQRKVKLPFLAQKTPLLSIMDMNVTRNLHKTYIFVSFLPDSPPFPPVLSRTFRAPPRPFREPPGDPAGTSGSIRGGHAIHILHMGAPGRSREEPGRNREGPVVHK